MAAQILPEAHPGADGFYGAKDQRDEGVQDKTGAGIQVTHSGHEAPNPTLEAVAESKGRWFQYVKTKQFWITLLLGQGTSTSTSPKTPCTSTQDSNIFWWCSSGDLHHVDKYALDAPRKRRNLDPGIPELL